MPDDAEKQRKSIGVGRTHGIGEHGTDRHIEFILSRLQVIRKSVSLCCIQKKWEDRIDGLRR